MKQKTRSTIVLNYHITFHIYTYLIIVFSFTNPWWKIVTSKIQLVISQALQILSVRHAILVRGDGSVYWHEGALVCNAWERNDVQFRCVVGHIGRKRGADLHPQYRRCGSNSHACLLTDDPKTCHASVLPLLLLRGALFVIQATATADTHFPCTTRGAGKFTESQAWSSVHIEPHEPQAFCVVKFEGVDLTYK